MPRVIITAQVEDSTRWEEGFRTQGALRRRWAPWERRKRAREDWISGIGVSSSKVSRVLSLVRFARFAVWPLGSAETPARFGTRGQPPLRASKHLGIPLPQPPIPFRTSTTWTRYSRGGRSMVF
jgi:hypothetical protein